MKKKVNKIIIVRLLTALAFWTVFFFPALFIPRKFQYKTLWPIFTNLFLFATKIKPHYCSNFNLNKNGPYILASNHRAFIDTYVITKFIRSPFSIVHKIEMTQNILFKLMSWKMGLISIDRNELLSQKKAISKTKKMISKNCSIILFPEGWYSLDEPVGKLKRGIAKIAKETDIEVLPMAIYGIDNNFVYEDKLSWRNVYLKAGTPIKYNDYKDEKHFLESLKTKIKELYLSLKKEKEKL